MNSESYLKNLYMLFLQHFESVANRTNEPELQHRIQGYIKAGEDLGVISRAQSSKIMEDAHLEVFGESIVQRQRKKQGFKEALRARDEKYFELPPDSRK